MKLENQVCTLEQAKKLAELGVIVVSEFYYIKGRLIRGDEYSSTFKWAAMLGKLSKGVYPAYTVAELREMPGKYIVMRYASDLLFRLYDEKGLLIDWIRGTQNNIEAQARAEALIWLLENNYITAQQINEAA